MKPKQVRFLPDPLILQRQQTIAPLLRHGLGSSESELGSRDRSERRP
jgi:hypothetical protein